MKLLDVKSLNKTFRTHQSQDITHAVNHISFRLNQGEILGLVGESGCGKSTIAKLLSGLIQPDSGVITFDGEQLTYPFNKSIYQKLQLIFQMPQSSFDPLKTVGKSLIAIQRNIGIDKNSAKQNAITLLEKVGLNQSFMAALPSQLSGGECQRIAIARALLLSPKMIICDEITSSLDVSVQAQIISLLLSLKKDLNVSLIFISHDLVLVQSFCDRILVMKDGEVVDNCVSSEILERNQSPYTLELFNATLQIP